MKLKILTVRASKNGNLKAIPLSDGAYRRCWYEEAKYCISQQGPILLRCIHWRMPLTGQWSKQGWRISGSTIFGIRLQCGLCRPERTFIGSRNWWGISFDQEDRTVFSPVSRKPSIIGSYFWWAAQFGHEARADEYRCTCSIVENLVILDC